MNYRTRSETYNDQAFLTAFTDGLKLPRKIDAAEWASEYRFLSSEFSARAGRYSHAPYQVEPLQVISDPRTQRVLILASSQSGKSETIANAVGYFANVDPCPMLLMQPTGNLADAWSERLMMMFRDTQQLKGIISTQKEKGVSTRHKPFRGGSLTFVGANSPSELASRPIRIVLADEIDAYPKSAGKEGSPLRLAFTRTESFPNRKIVCVTSPRHEFDASYEYWLASDQRQFFAPCHQCGEYQILEWEQVVWDKDDAGVPLPETARYECTHCKEPWSDGQRKKNCAKGHWQATAPENEWVAFRFNVLVSPFAQPLKEYVQEWLSVQGDHFALQTFLNTKLCKWWKDQGSTVNHHGLAARAEDYDQSTIPNQVAYLTCGIDTQKDRLVYEVLGWGLNGENWSIEYDIISLDPHSPAAWQAIDDLLARTFYRADGAELKIKAVCHDAAGGTWYDVVLTEARKRHNGKHSYYPIKGADKPDSIFPSRVSITSRKKAHIYVLGVSVAKDKVYEDLRRKQAGLGYCHFPTHYEDWYYEGLTSEEKRYKTVGGIQKAYWYKRPSVENEPLDCRVYNYAAFQGSRPNIEAELNRIQQRLADAENPSETQKEINNFTSKLAKRRRRLDGWRSK